jgi:Ala-tRNA(Pro) deacylase
MAQTTPLIDPEIEAALKEVGINFETYSHPAFDTCEISSAWHHENGLPGQRVKNLVLRNKNGKQYFLLLLPHQLEFDKQIFKAHSGQKCGLAAADRLRELMKAVPGSVSPLNLIYDSQKALQVYLEKTLLEAPYLHFHAGSSAASVQITPADLQALLQAWQYELQVIDWHAPTPRD